MTTAAIFLGLAALGGLTMVIMRLKGTPLPPTGLALAHGGIAAIGVIILAYTAATTSIPQQALIALGIFVLAALGGLAIFLMFHLKNRPLPIPLILGHGLIAVIGFVMLVLTIYQGPKRHYDSAGRIQCLWTTARCIASADSRPNLRCRRLTNG
jgi:hypothetical protein